MGYCKNCGSELPDGLGYCPTCGELVHSSIDLNKPNNAGGFAAPNSNTNSGVFQAPDTSNSINDPRFGTPCDVSVTGKANILVNIISFLFPIIGIIFLSLVWRTERMTKKYDSLAICMLVRTALDIIFGFISTVFLILALASAFGY